MNNFWKKIKSQTSNVPFFVLAPMEDVTDTVFRQIVQKANQGMPQILFTEFTNCDGICSVGKARVIHRLRYTEVEKPLVAQIWGKTPQNYYETAKLCLEMGFDGVDINFGCPEKNVIKQGCCSAMIKTPHLAQEIIEATKSGVDNQIPVSVKTRIGFSKIQTEEWIPFLLEQNLPALTIHGRTVAGSELPANWEEIQKTVNLRNQYLNKNVNNLPETKKQAILYNIKEKWCKSI
jgi:tRNA-dihydrouridine synthase